MSIGESSENGPSPAPLKSRVADTLDVHGGVVLLISGVALIVLASVFANRAAVAPIFAVSGASLIVLAAFYSRIEGNVQANQKGVQLAVRAAQRKAKEQGLPPYLMAEVIEQTLERLQISSRRRDVIEREAEEAASEAVDSVSRDPRAKEFQIVDHFANWLASSDGGAFPVVRTGVRTPDGEFDVLADGGDEILMAETKALNRPIDVGIVRQLASRTPPADLQNRKVRRALVLPAGSELTMGARGEAERVSIEVYTVRENGSVNRLI